MENSPQVSRAANKGKGLESCWRAPEADFAVWGPVKDGPGSKAATVYRQWSEVLPNDWLNGIRNSKQKGANRAVVRLVPLVVDMAYRAFMPVTARRHGMVRVLPSPGMSRFGRPGGKEDQTQGNGADLDMEFLKIQKTGISICKTNKF